MGLADGRAVHILGSRCSGAVVLCLPGAATSSVHSNVYAELTQSDHRLPGAPEFEQSFAAVSNALRTAGLGPPGAARFDTLVPRTELCTLHVEGRGSRAQCYPLNNGVSPIVTDGELTGPARVAGDQCPADAVRRGGSTAAACARRVRRSGSRGPSCCADLADHDISISSDFRRGAQAVLFVGSEDVSAVEDGIGLRQGPRHGSAFLRGTRGAGQESRPVCPAEGKAASIRTRVALRDVVGKNLWVELPGATRAPNSASASKRTSFFSATLGTADRVVPDLRPQQRQAANARAVHARGMPPGSALPAPRAGRSSFSRQVTTRRRTEARHLYYALHQAAKEPEESGDSLVLSRRQVQGGVGRLHKPVRVVRRRRPSLPPRDEHARQSIAIDRRYWSVCVGA